MFLLFDASANGRPKNWKTPAVDTFNWPRLIHLAWLLYDKKGNLVSDQSQYVKHDEMSMSQDSIDYHKVDLEEMDKNGKKVSEILEAFTADAKQAVYAFSFNEQFNENVVKAEYYRISAEPPFSNLENYCLMRESTYFCRIMGKDGRLKWPSLPQLHTKLFGGTYDQIGNAKYDLMAVSRCFNKLLDLGQLDDLF